MIKFFQRIRRKLSDEGSLSKYLVYAVGEIALVVIGILIALQINNWNEWKKERATEILLLNSLKEEITANIEQLENGISIHKTSKEMCVLLLQHFGDPERIINSEFLDSLSEYISYPFGVNLKKGIVKSIIATGDLKTIKNEAIIEFITVFEDRIQEISNHFVRLDRIYQEQLWPLEHKYVRRLIRAQKTEEVFSDGKMNLGSPDSSDYERFFEDIVLENTYVLTLFEQTDFIDAEELLLNHMKDALALINDELNNRNIDKNK